jgi:hypothetical protein
MRPPGAGAEGPDTQDKPRAPVPDCPWGQGSRGKTLWMGARGTEAAGRGTGPGWPSPVRGSGVSVPGPRRGPGGRGTHPPGQPRRGQVPAPKPGALLPGPRRPTGDLGSSSQVPAACSIDEQGVGRVPSAGCSPPCAGSGGVPTPGWQARRTLKVRAQRPRLPPPGGPPGPLLPGPGAGCIRRAGTDARHRNPRRASWRVSRSVARSRSRW